MNNVLTDLPPRVRYWLYIVFAVVGLGIGGVDVWGSETLWGHPVENYLRVYAYVGLGLGFTAASNTPAPKEYQGKHEKGRVDLAYVALAGTLVLLLLVVLTLPGRG